MCQSTRLTQNREIVAAIADQTVTQVRSYGGGLSVYLTMSNGTVISAANPNVYPGTPAELDDAGFELKIADLPERELAFA